MKIVKKDEGYTRDVKIEGLNVWFNHLTLHKASGNNYALRTGFNFTGVPEEVVRRLAGETLLIRWRTAFKNADKVDNTADNQLVDVVKMLTGRKPRLSKVERAEKLFTEMSAAEKLALIRKLQDEIPSDEEKDDEVEEIEEDLEEEEEEEEE